MMRLPLPLLLGLFASSVLAAGGPTALWPVNDQRYGGRGADPIPLKPTPVVLRAAEIKLVEVPVQDGWQVTATYELYNPAEAATAVSLVLPEESCARDRRPCTPMAGMFQDLGTRLGEELIEPSIAPKEAVQPWANPPGQGHLYQITLPPKQARVLESEYRLDRSRGAQFSGVELMSSAGRWGGPVGRVRHVIELAQPVPYVLYPRGFKLEKFIELPRAPGPGARVQLSFVAEEVAARRDLKVVLPDDAVSGRTAAGFCEGFRGDKSDAELVPILARYDRALLRACRDLVYALHGRPFADPALRARYYGAPPELPAWAQQGGLLIQGRPENRAFKEGLLSPGEQAYVRALTAAERRVAK